MLQLQPLQRVYFKLIIKITEVYNSIFSYISRRSKPLLRADKIKKAQRKGCFVVSSSAVRRKWGNLLVHEAPSGRKFMSLAKENGRLIFKQSLISATS